jgi:hypothetical protein
MAKSFPNTGATVIDTSADLPAASAALEGVMMFQKDTNELKICDGSSWISMLDTDTPPGLVHISSFATGSVTSYPINNVFSSAFTNYKLILRQVAAASADIDVALRLRTSGTDATTNYQTMGQYMQDNGTGSAYIGTNASLWYLGQADGATVGPYYAASIDIYSPFVNAQTFATTLVSTVSQAGFSTGFWLSHNRSVSASHDGFTLLAPTGATISLSGTIYGYKG